MLTCSWSGSTAPGAKRISAVISPVERSNSSVFASQPGNRVFCHSMFCGFTTWECVSAVSCLAFGVTASMAMLRSLEPGRIIAAWQPPVSALRRAA